MNCIFCRIIGGADSADVVFQDEISLAVLDRRPLFPGHCLLVPRNHYETLGDLPAPLIGPLFANAQLLSRAVELAMAAGGSFVAINNRVSQSVPHLHVHVVPRNPKDGLKGFFWPRQPYKDADQATRVRESIRDALARIRSAGTKQTV